MIDNKTKELLKVLWDYLALNMKLEKCDLIMGCGCSDLDIPIKCSELLKEGYADKILFSGGLGKVTYKTFKESEAETYKDIAIKCGIDPNMIFVETESQNTGDNFRRSLEVIRENNIKADSILIVHAKLSERRTLNTAKTVMPDKHLIITSPDKTFEEFIDELNNMSKGDIESNISIIVGDIQRIIIYPQFGWQLKQNVSDGVIDAYQQLKNLGYNKFIWDKLQIDEMIKKYDIKINEEINYFS